MCAFGMQMMVGVLVKRPGKDQKTFVIWWPLFCCFLPMCIPQTEKILKEQNNKTRRKDCLPSLTETVSPLKKKKILPFYWGPEKQD
jgi:hypothetical protein